MYCPAEKLSCNLRHTSAKLEVAVLCYCLFIQAKKLDSLAAWAGSLGDDEYLAQAAAMKSVGQEVLSVARQYLKDYMRAVVAASNINEEDYMVRGGLMEGVCGGGGVGARGGVPVGQLRHWGCVRA